MGDRGAPGPGLVITNQFADLTVQNSAVQYIGNVGETYRLDLKISNTGGPPLTTRESVTLSVEANSVSRREVRYRIVVGDEKEHFAILL